MKNVRPSLWALAAVALGIIGFLAVYSGKKENNQPEQVQVSKPVTEVAEVQVISGQPKVQEAETTNVVSQTIVVTNNLFKAGFTGFEVK